MVALVNVGGVDCTLGVGVASCTLGVCVAIHTLGVGSSWGGFDVGSKVTLLGIVVCMIGCSVDVAGKWPVWLLCIVSAALWIFINTSHIFFGGGSLWLFSSCVVSSLILVNLTPCLCFFM